MVVSITVMLYLTSVYSWSSDKIDCSILLFWNMEKKKRLIREVWFNYGMLGLNIKKYRLISFKINI